MQAEGTENMIFIILFKIVEFPDSERIAPGNVFFVPAEDESTPAIC